MGFSASPEASRVPLPLKPQTIAHKIPPIPTAEDMPEVGPQKFPALKVRPKGESINVVEPAAAELSDRAVQMAIGGKMKSVIPKKRKLVKTMIYHAIKDFVKSLFRQKPSAGSPP